MKDKNGRKLAKCFKAGYRCPYEKYDKSTGEIYCGKKGNCGWKQRRADIR